MRTPREILLDRQRAAIPALDAIRKRAIASAPKTQPGPKENPWMGWRILIMQYVLGWRALAAIWVCVLGLNLATYSEGKLQAKGKASPALLTALQDQKRLLAELLGPAAQPPTHLPNVSPRPRSAISRRAVIA